MIETLSIAAEITAALLLLSLSWDGPRFSRTHDPLPPGKTPAKKSTGGDLTRLRFPVWRWTGTVAQSSEGRITLESNRMLIVSELAEWYQSLPAEHLDHLTGLTNLQGIEENLAQARSHWKPSPAHVMLGLLRLDQYDEMTTSHTRMFSDLAIRHLGAILRDQLSHVAIVGRIAPDRFLVAFLDWEPSLAQSMLEKMRAAVGAELFMREQHSQKLTLSSSLLKCRDSDTIESALPVLESSLTEFNAGHNTYRWRDGADWQPSDITKSEPVEIATDNQDQSINAEIPIEAAVPNNTHSTELISDLEPLSITTVSSDPPPSNHTSDNDIESHVSVAKRPPSTLVQESPDRVIADDIEALLTSRTIPTGVSVRSAYGMINSESDSAKRVETHQTTVLASTPKSNPTILQAPLIAEANKTERANADDIEALLASLGR